MAPHSSTLAWKIPWMEEPGRLQFMGSLRVGHDWATSLSLSTFMHWRGNGNPLQCSCLENPRDGEAWWAAVYGVAQSWTRLKRLSNSNSNAFSAVFLWWSSSTLMLSPLWDSHRCLQSSCGWSVTYGSSTIKSWLSGMLKNWCFWAVALEKTLYKSPLDCREIKSVNPKGNQSWIFIRRTDAEAAAPILWQPDAKNWLIGNDPDAGKDWRQEEKGATEDKMIGWYHWLNGHELEPALADGEGQGNLACCIPWGCKKSDTTEQLNNNKVEHIYEYPHLVLVLTYYRFMVIIKSVKKQENEILFYMSVSLFR